MPLTNGHGRYLYITATPDQALFSFGEWPLHIKFHITGSKSLTTVWIWIWIYLGCETSGFPGYAKSLRTRGFGTGTKTYCAVGPRRMYARRLNQRGLLCATGYHTAAATGTRHALHRRYNAAGALSNFQGGGSRNG